VVDRRTVFIDLPSIAADATVTQSGTVTGSELVTPARAQLLWPTQQVASAHRAYYCSGVTRQEQTQFV